MRKEMSLFLAIAGFVLLVGCGTPEQVEDSSLGQQEMQAITLTQIPSPTSTNTPIPTPSPTSTNTPTPTPSPTPTNTPTPTPSPSPTNTPTPTLSPTPTNTPTPALSPTPVLGNGIITEDGVVLSDETIGEYRDENNYLEVAIRNRDNCYEGDNKLAMSCKDDIIIDDNYFINLETFTKKEIPWSFYYVSVESSDPTVLIPYVYGNGDNSGIADEHYTVEGIVDVPNGYREGVDYYYSSSGKTYFFLKNVRHNIELFPLKNGTTTLYITLYNEKTGEVYDKKEVAVTVSGVKEKTGTYILKESKIGDDIYCKYYNNGHLYIEGSGQTWTCESGFSITEGNCGNRYMIPREVAKSITHIIVSGNITKFDISCLNGIGIVEHISFPESVTKFYGSPGCSIVAGGTVDCYKGGKYASWKVEAMNEYFNGMTLYWFLFKGE